MNRATYRGQPLVALLLVLGGWVAVRAMVWDAQGPGAAVAMDRPGFALQVPGGDVAEPRRASLSSAAIPPVIPTPISPVVRPLEFTQSHASSSFAKAPLTPARVRPTRSPASHRQALARATRRPVVAALQPDAPVAAPLPVGNRMSWLATLVRMRLPKILVPFAAQGPASVPHQPLDQRDRRWSADAWLLLRQGGSAAAVAGFVPTTYGASQAGAVVRYRLAPESAHRPAIYLRGSSALNGSREHEAALGLSARPFARVPVAIAAEGRINHQPSGTRLRPAAFAYTELPPFALPLGARGEFYGQAGYVGGNFASAFADGQLRVDRPVVTLGHGELRAGGGLWGGAQKGAERLDIGPSATFALPLGGPAGARVGVDWRFRVAGDAAPASGPALTLSAGF